MAGVEDLNVEEKMYYELVRMAYADDNLSPKEFELLRQKQLEWQLSVERAMAIEGLALGRTQELEPNPESDPAEQSDSAPFSLTLDNRACREVKLIVEEYKSTKPSNIFLEAELSTAKTETIYSQFPIQGKPRILAFVDTTVRLNARCGVLILPTGIYWNNPRYIESLRRMVSWEQFQMEQLRSGVKWRYDTELGEGNIIDLAGFGNKQERLKLLEMFKAIQFFILDSAS